MERDTINLWKEYHVSHGKIMICKVLCTVVVLVFDVMDQMGNFAQYDKGGSVNHVTMFYASSIAFARLF